MRRMPTAKLLLIVSFSTLLSACETPYAPAGNFAGFDYGGYSDTRISGNTAIVRFSANSHTSKGQLDTDLLYRCAQVTINNGYDYFVVTHTTDSPVNVHVNTISTYGDYQTFPPRMHDSYFQRIYPDTYHYSISQTPVNSLKLFSSSAVIKMFNGRPDGIPNSFDARDVSAHYGPSTF